MERHSAIWLRRCIDAFTSEDLEVQDGVLVGDPQRLCDCAGLNIRCIGKILYFSYCLTS